MNKRLGAVCGLIAMATATAASAGMNDREYLQANRCRGLATSQTLGVLDTTIIDQKIARETQGRDPNMVDRGEQFRHIAENDARRPNESMRARLIAERDGVCSTYFS